MVAFSLNRLLLTRRTLQLCDREIEVRDILRGDVRFVRPSPVTVLIQCLSRRAPLPALTLPDLPPGPKLHVGAGQRSIGGYENIDGFEDDKRPGYFQTTAQRICRAEILDAIYEPESVAEIRSHHMFEHISILDVDRTLRGWNKILKTGGQVWLEVPDFDGCVRQILRLRNERDKEIYYRAIFGSQVSAGEFHNNAFTAARLINLLEDYGFETKLAFVHWQRREPVKPHMWYPSDLPLPDLTVRAVKVGSPKREILDSDWTHIAYRKIYPNPDLVEAERAAASDRSFDEEARDVVAFNERNRNAWVARIAAGLAAGTRILDVGAGPARYRSLFSHCDYQTQDFLQYKGNPDGPFAETWSYGKIDYVSDITSIPVPDASFDAVLCTEVLEHVPEPIRALAEIARVLKSGGELFLTAPLSSALHQEPYHFYGGYTPYFYRKFLGELGFEIVSIEPNGGLFLHTAQEVHRSGHMIDDDMLAAFTPEDRQSLLRMKHMMTTEVPRWLGRMEKVRSIPESTIGYHVHAVKRR